MEFYSTFRIGEPACSEISREFKHCWMISRSESKTNLRVGGVIEGRYVYLFRKWRNLLETAVRTPNIWIANYDKQLEFIKNLHQKLEKMRGFPSAKLDLDDFADDLPAFLLSLDSVSLNNLLTSINKNVVEREKCVCEMHTIHNYKGLENDIVRVFNDMEIPKDDKLYYVALTRGCREIVLDKRHYCSNIGINKPTSKIIGISKKLSLKLNNDVDNMLDNDELVSDPKPKVYDTNPKPKVYDTNPKITPVEIKDPVKTDELTLKYSLIAYRNLAGNHKNTPCYRILSNSTINLIVEKRPQTKDELLNINGIGKKKLDEYGDDILKIVRGEKVMDISDIKEVKVVDPSEYLCPELVMGDNETSLWVLFDLETTGLSSKTDEITQVCFKFIAKTGNNIKELEVFTSFIRTSKTISEEVSQLTGIKSEDVVGAPIFEDVYNNIMKLVDDYYKKYGISNCIWVAHNGYRFDFPILYRYIVGLKTKISVVSSLKHWCVDSLDLIRCCEWSSKLESLSLGSVYEYLVGKPMEISHQADADVKAMFEIFKLGNLFTDRLKNIYREKYFLDNKPKLPSNKRRSGTSVITLNLFKEGKSIEDISRSRGLKEATIYNHLINCCGDDYITYDKFMDELEYKTIMERLNSYEVLPNLSTIRTGMPRSITYPKIKLVIALRNV